MVAEHLYKALQREAGKGSSGTVTSPWWRREGTTAAGLGTKQLEGLPGGDPRRVALAKLVRKRTAWKAPNTPYPGSKIEVYFVEGSSFDLSYRGRRQDLRRGLDSVLIAGDSGEEFTWTLSNQSSSF